MKKAIIIAILILILMPLASFAQTASPQTANPCSTKTYKDQSGSIIKAQPNMPRCINQIYRWSLGVVGILAILMVVYGGYLVMLSAGNAEQATKGKEMIFSAIVGMLILFTAYLILNTINPDLVRLEVRGILDSTPNLPSTTQPVGN